MISATRSNLELNPARRTEQQGPGKGFQRVADADGHGPGDAGGRVEEERAGRHTGPEALAQQRQDSEREPRQRRGGRGDVLGHGSEQPGLAAPKYRAATSATSAG
jgi:hypothetical protein